MSFCEGLAVFVGLQHAEHFIAYLGTAIILGLTFRKRPRLAVQCCLLIVYAAILEAGQLYSPGRHASFQDLAFSSAGVVFGGLFSVDGTPPRDELAENLASAAKILTNFRVLGYFIVSRCDS